MHFLAGITMSQESPGSRSNCRVVEVGVKPACTFEIHMERIGQTMPICQVIKMGMCKCCITLFGKGYSEWFIQGHWTTAVTPMGGKDRRPIPWVNSNKSHTNHCAVLSSKIDHPETSWPWLSHMIHCPPTPSLMLCLSLEILIDQIEGQTFW